MQQRGYNPYGQHHYPAPVDWEKFNRTHEIDTKKLPPKARRFFESVFQLIIGSKARLSRVKEKHLPFFTYYQDYIFTLGSYPLLVNDDHIYKEVGMFDGKLDLMISVDGVGFLHGPMSHSQQDVRQTLTTHNEPEPQNQPLPFGRRN